MFLVIIGTLEQMSSGIFYAQEYYFRSLWITAPLPFFQYPIPIFPGGAFIAFALIINLCCTQYRYRHSLKKFPMLFLIHFGLILLIGGEIGVLSSAKESQMNLQEGESKNYTEQKKESELVIFKELNDSFIEETVIPFSYFKENNHLDINDYHLKLNLKNLFLNSIFYEYPQNIPHEQQISKGFGKEVFVASKPLSKKDTEIAFPSLILNINDDNDLGVWLLSTAFGQPQFFISKDIRYGIYLRPSRTYLPFWIKLISFYQETYKGTEIPKSFKSAIEIYDDQGKLQQSSLIEMNEPLRAFSKVFYQSSFSLKNGRRSIFHVVDNPYRSLPYIALSMMVLGLVGQFFHMIFKKKNPTVKHYVK